MIKNKKGFTLIEMLIVITIIALLASLILVGMGGARAKTRDSRRVADLHNVMNALELYYSLNYAYPGTMSWDDLSEELTSSEVVSRIPQDPLNSSDSNRTYQYGASDDFQDYVLGVALETEDAVLSSDIDGTVHTIDCGIAGGAEDGDEVYCVRP